MKLYATVSSERASKGQGGKWIDINISGEKQGIAVITVRENSTYYDLGIVSPTETRNIRIEKKGNKQKGELCGNCYKRQANEGDTLCETCAKQNAL
jgi:hypothetical protein